MPSGSSGGRLVELEVLMTPIRIAVLVAAVAAPVLALAEARPAAAPAVQGERVLVRVKDPARVWVDPLPGSRVLEGRFSAVQQSIGVPRPREAALAQVRDFVAEAKASGLVASAIDRHGVRGVSVAP
jgi:hypothetical protein